MTDDIDVEALLEDTYNKKKSSRSVSSERRDRKSSHHRHRRRRSESSEEGDKDRRRRRSREKRRHRRRSSTPDRYSRRRDSGGRKVERKFDKRWSNMVDRKDMIQLTDAERDARTVLLMQLTRDVTNRDIEEFFADVGKIRDIRMISDRVSRRSKGIAYVEFQHIESVSMALRMSNKVLRRCPVIIQNTMSEKNRAALEIMAQAKNHGPCKLYVGSLDQNITEKMLKAIFEPFGTIDGCSINYDDNGRSKGYGNITFKDAECAKLAIEKMNGFELVGKKIRVGQSSDSATMFNQPSFNTDILDDEEIDKGGVSMNATSRAMLMQKLAASKGLGGVVQNAQAQQSLVAPAPCSNPTNCVILSNMFDSQKDAVQADVLKEIENDVYKVVSKFAQIRHIHVDKTSSEGNVYLKLDSTKEATAVVDDMNGRKYAGRVIKAFNVSSNAYHSIFPNILS